MSIDAEAEIEEVDQYEALKHCSHCDTDKPLADFYKNADARDGLHSQCKACMSAKYARRKQEKIDVEGRNKELALTTLDRVKLFTRGYKELSELTDDEISGRFIYSSDFQTKTPVDKLYDAQSRNKFVAKFNKEVSLRINDFIKSKANRAVQIIFEIADSELVEPADRHKAAVWLAERVIGKTPEVLLTGDAGKVYEDIFDTSVETTSRDDYRKAVESGRDQAILEIESEDQRSGDNLSNEILDVEIEEDDLEADPLPVGYDGDSGSNGIRGSTEISDGPDGGVSDDLRVLPGNGNNESKNPGFTDNGQTRLEFRNEKERLKKARQKAKQRRFAARAIGATSISRLPYFLEFSLIKTGAMAGKLRCRLVCPSDITEARLDKLNETNALTDAALEILYPQVEDESETSDSDEEIIISQESENEDGKEPDGFAEHSGRSSENEQTL